MKLPGFLGDDLLAKNSENSMESGVESMVEFFKIPEKLGINRGI